MKALCVVLVVVILIAITIIFIQAFSSEPGELTLQDKAVCFITEVAMLDLSKYNVTITIEQPYASDGVVREYLRFNLKSDGNTYGLSVTFINGTLTNYYLYSLSYPQPLPPHPEPLPATSLDAVKGFLQRYYAYSKSSIVQEALGILDNVSELKTMNVTVGNLKMRVVDSNIGWLRVVNGLEFPTGLSIYLNNVIVDGFSDESSFYRIGSADVNVSREEAIRIAREEAKKYSKVTLWGIGAFPFKVAEEPWIVYLYVGTGNFTSYPYWYVWFVADPEVYSVTGVEVRIRADTGEISCSRITRGFGP